MKKRGRITAFIIVVIIILAVVGFTTKPTVNQINLGLDLQGGFEVLYEVHPTVGDEVTGQMLSDTVAAISKRINLLGVTEPDINIEKPNRIRVALAGVTNPDEAREKIGKTAELTFRNEAGEIVMRGTSLKKAGVAFDNTTNAPIITLELKDPKEFEKITRENLGKKLAIYLDEDLLSDPTVSSVIPGGTATITGQGTVEQNKELADILNAGALPAKLTEIQSNVVGASLGMLALHQSLIAGLLAAIFIFIFMLAYYRMPGLVANISLIAFVYLVILTFALMGVTLTLPGIAALVLGMGIAVDANIITFERIKEEMRSGKSTLSSIKAGFKRSLSTILDSHITTIIAAVVLFYLGTGAIKGFAVALIINIVINLLTNVLGSRILLSMLAKSNMFNKPGYFGVKEADIREL